MNKIINTVALSVAACSIAMTSCILLKQKSKNMLDIIIDEIETMK